jgi:hypothetical protein
VRHILKKIYAGVYTLAITAALVLHFVIKDQTYTSSLWFYALPLPVLLFLVLISTWCIPKVLKRYNITLALILLTVWLARSFKLTFTDEIPVPKLEIVLWNVANNNTVLDAFKRGATLPDVAVLIEYSAQEVMALKALHPSYYIYNDTIGKIGIFSKTPLQIKAHIPSRYQTTVVNFKTKGINFYAVDVSGSIDVPRSWGLDVVNTAISTTKNTVVLGDFNVPYESVLLKDLKSNFQHAFSEKGTGFRETWFWGLPILSLDHVWVSKDLEVIKVDKVHTPTSDHAMLKLLLKP